MRKLLAIIPSFAMFVFLVFNPLRANLIASLATKTGINAAAEAQLLGYASTIVPCDTDILSATGDAHVKAQNPTMAAIYYGKAMTCSPAHPAYRFKYGQALLMMGFAYGASCVDDALRLEPHNPIFQAEHERLEKLLATTPR